MAQDFWSLMTGIPFRAKKAQNQPQDRLVEEATQDIISDKVSLDFDPEGSGYDFDTAKLHKLGPDSTGHWPSRVPGTGQILKGRQHETWDKTINQEAREGYDINKSDDGKYYSKKNEDAEAYNQMVENLGIRYGVSGDDMENLMDKISFHESKRDASAQQIGGGPGKGLFQFESGVDAGGQTAMNRLRRWYDENQMDLPDWAAVSEDGVDASKLTPQQQKMLFMANTRYHPTASFRPEAIENTADWWAKYHWAGDESDKADRLASFESDMRYA